MKVTHLLNPSTPHLLDSLQSQTAPIPSQSSIATTTSTGIASSISHDNQRSVGTSIEFPGKIVCAVEYRKVVYKWNDWKKGDPQLEKGNRWAVSSVVRGGSSSIALLEVNLDFFLLCVYTPVLSSSPQLARLVDQYHGWVCLFHEEEE